MATRFFEPATRRASLWLLAFALIGVALTLLYHDAEQQDSAYHFLFARWAAAHPVYFVSVWARPLFTLVYWLPSQFGYPAAKLFTVLVSLATGWQTFRLAQQKSFQRAELAAPFLFFQPAFFAISSAVMTETLFALLFVIALRLHLRGWIKTGLLVASSLILIRPEGFFIGLLWGLWGLWEKPEIQPSGCNLKSQISNLKSGSLLKAGLQTLLLAGGMIVWWAAAYLLTGDTLWIVHDWPSDWQMGSRANGIGPIWWYAALLPLIVGFPLIVPFLAGLWRLLRRREFVCGTSAFLTLFVLHSVMFTRGWFGSAGYARYFVCVSPAIALITLTGWNALADRGGKLFDLSKPIFASLIILASAVVCFVYVDGIRFTRDAQAVEWMRTWLLNNHSKFSESSTGSNAKLISSQAYSQILFDRDPWERPSFSSDHDHNLELIRQSPAQTLVLWDDETGPKLYGLRAEDFEAAGYERLKAQDFKLEGWFVRLPWNHWGGPRQQRMHWFYKIGMEPRL
ncbi:MAG: hypothetical protein M3X11_19920 [Acidobacteriota bacterium]|nr:hypothetical protein [Acidobacteriota bacterium]